MDHQEALRLNATEKYFLGELQGDLREAFEEHYFGCSECALDVRVTAAMMEAGRHVALADRPSVAPVVVPVRPAQAPAARPSWFAWFLRPAFTVPAMAAMLLFIGYQNLAQLPKFFKAGSAKIEYVRTVTGDSTSRKSGAAKKRISIGAHDPLYLSLDLDPNEAANYYVTIHSGNSNGPVIVSLDIPRSDDHNTLTIRLAEGTLTSGDYTVTVLGYSGSAFTGTGNQVDSESFALEIRR